MHMHSYSMYCNRENGHAHAMHARAAIYININIAGARAQHKHDLAKDDKQQRMRKLTTHEAATRLLTTPNIPREEKWSWRRRSGREYRSV